MVDQSRTTNRLAGPSSSGVDWYAAAADGSVCDLKFTLQPNDVELDAATVEVWGHDSLWNAYLAALTEGDYWLEIVSDCSWSVTVNPVQG